MYVGYLSKYQRGMSAVVGRIDIEEERKTRSDRPKWR
jgi:hypothetical protein